MEICDAGHEQIVHEERACPLCVEIQRVLSLQGELEEVRDERDSMHDELQQAEEEMQKMREEKGN